MNRISLVVLNLFGNKIENSFELRDVIKSIIYIENYTKPKIISMDREQIYFLFSRERKTLRLLICINHLQLN